MRAAARLLVLLILMVPGTAFARQPVVVELFQSQGCSSCPPAIKNVNALADTPGVITLTFAVTYWDKLGWKDTFAKPEFTRRQYDYARGLHHSGVYTPQVVINGRSDLVGTDQAELTHAAQAAPILEGPAITLVNHTVSIGSGSSQAPLDVWLVRYDPRTLKVDIGAGENSGVSIDHRNVVRGLVKLGVWHAQAQSYDIPQDNGANLKSAILLQGENGGPIFSAASF